MKKHYSLSGLLLCSLICMFSCKVSDAKFFQIVQTGSYEEIEKAIKKKADVNAVDENGMTILMAAVSGQCGPEGVQLLLDAGADLSVKDKNNKTALLWAAEKTECTEVLEVLYDAGAYDIAPKREQDDAMFLVIANKALNNTCIDYLFRRYDIDDALYNLAGSGLDKEIHKAIQRGADVNYGYHDFNTSFGIAVRTNNNPDVIKAFIEAGADVNAYDYDKKTILMYAIENNSNPEILQVLLLIRQINSLHNLNNHDILC